VWRCGVQAKLAATSYRALHRIDEAQASVSLTPKKLAPRVPIIEVNRRTSFVVGGLRPGGWRWPMIQTLAKDRELIVVFDCRAAGGVTHVYYHYLCERFRRPRHDCCWSMGRCPLDVCETLEKDSSEILCNRRRNDRQRNWPAWNCASAATLDLDL
jgi:hypothetical protein